MKLMDLGIVGFKVEHKEPKGNMNNLNKRPGLDQVLNASDIHSEPF